MTNVTPFDSWSLVHIASGIVLGAVGVPLTQTMTTLIGFEVMEWTLEHPSGSRLFGTKRHESQVNVAADIGVALLAYALTREMMNNRGL